MFMRIAMALSGQPFLMLVPRTEHVAARPTWDCLVCDQPWPCAVAKVELSEQYTPTMLSLFLASCWFEVLEQLINSDADIPKDLYDRFLGWIARTKTAGTP
jgi:hypothetical protein